MFYIGHCISKHTDCDLEKGDMGFVAYKDAEETVDMVRFRLSEVLLWKTVEDPIHYYKDKREKVQVELMNDNVIIILDTLQNFDYIMQEYLRPKPFKNLN